MVWNYEDGKIDPSFYSVPEEKRAGPESEAMTIICIRKRWYVEHKNEFYGDAMYIGGSKMAGIGAGSPFSEYAEVAVLYWPENKIAGVAKLHDPPPASVNCRQSSIGGYQSCDDGYGNIDIAEWIKSLPAE